MGDRGQPGDAHHAGGVSQRGFFGHAAHVLFGLVHRFGHLHQSFGHLRVGISHAHEHRRNLGAAGCVVNVAQRDRAHGHEAVRERLILLDQVAVHAGVDHGHRDVVERGAVMLADPAHGLQRQRQGRHGSRVQHRPVH